MSQNELEIKLLNLKQDAIALCLAHEQVFHDGKFCSRVRFDLVAALTIFLAKDNHQQHGADCSS